MNLLPLNDRVIIKPKKEQESKSSGGIILTGTQAKADNIGTVVATASDSMVVSADTVVLYGTEIESVQKVDGEEYLIMKESNLIAIVNED